MSMNIENIAILLILNSCVFFFALLKSSKCTPAPYMGIGITIIFIQRGFKKIIIWIFHNCISQVMHPHYILQGDVPPCSAFFNYSTCILSQLLDVLQTLNLFINRTWNINNISRYSCSPNHGQNIKRSKKENKWSRTHLTLTITLLTGWYT